MNKLKKKIDILLLVVVLIFSFSFLLGWASEKNRQLPLQRYMESVNANADVAEDVSVVEAEPTVYVVIAEYAEDNAYIFASVVIQELPAFQALEVELTYNPDVLQFNVYPESVSRTQWSFQSVDVTDVSPGVLRITCIEPCVKDWQSVFETLSFQVIGEGEPRFDASLVACKDISGADIDCSFMLGYADEVSALPSERQADEQNGYAVPTVKLDVSTPAVGKIKPPEDFADAVSDGMDMQSYYPKSTITAHVYPKDYSFENCELLITYDPDVLEYSLIRIVNNQLKLSDSVLRMEDGEIHLLVSGDGANYTDPIVFNVIGNGNAELNVELLSYTDTSGVREDVQLVADIPEMKLKTSDFYVDNMAVKDYFLIFVKKTVRFFCDLFQYGDLYG